MSMLSGRAIPVQQNPRLRRSIPALSKMLWVIISFIFVSFAAVPAALASNCGYATTGTYKNSICWLDFTGYNDATAASAAGQPFTFTLKDGSILSLTVKKTGTSGVTPSAVPSYSGSAFGNGQYNNIPGLPVLYGNTNSKPFTIMLTNITVVDKNGVARAYDMFGADGESTDGNESLTFGTTGSAWIQQQIVPQGTSGTLCNAATGIGTTSVVWKNTTACAGNEGSLIVSSNNPKQISIAAVQGGLQGVVFGFAFPSITLNKTINGRANSADQFTLQIGYQSPPSTLASVTSTGNSTSVTTGPTAVLSGSTVVVSETMAAGSVSALSVYNPTINCTNAQASSATKLPSGAGSNFTITAALGDDISCQLTNTAPTTVAVQKVTNGAAGGPFSFTQTNLASAPVSITTSSPGTAAPASPPAIAVTTIGTAVTVSETLVAGYTLTSASCVDTNAAATGNSGAIGSLSGSVLTIPATAVKYGASFVCTFTNSKSATVTISKVTNGNTGTFSFSTTNLGGAASGLTTTAQGTAASTAPFTATAFTTVTTITETVPSAWSLASASCVDANSAVTGNPASFGTLSGSTLTIPAANIVAGAAITCKFTNTATSDMSISLTGLPTSASFGVPYSGTFTCSNAGAPFIAATAASCAATGLPAGVSVTSCSPTPPATVAPGASITCNVAGTPTAIGTSTVNGTTGATNDGNAANNTATTTITTTGADMVPDISGLPLTASVGVAYSGTLKCTNTATGPNAAAATAASCSLTGLPPGVSIGTCSPVPPATVALGASITCPVSGTPTAAGSTTFTATTGATNDTNGGTTTGGNNATTAAITTTGSDMTPDLTGLPATATVGTAYSGSIKCTNIGASSAIAASCSASGLPPGVTVGACSPVPPASVAAGASITCPVSGTPTTTGSSSVTVTTGATNDTNGGTTTGGNNATTQSIAVAGADMSIDLSGLPVTGATSQPYTGSFTCSNSSSTTITATAATCSVAGLPNGLSSSCSPVPPASVSPGGTIVCSVTGTPTVAGNSTVNGTTGAANDGNAANNTAKTSIAIAAPALSIVKSTTATSFSTVGAAVPYTFTVTNSGTVTINQPVTVSDSKISSVSCQALPSGGLVPNSSITCTGTYTTTQADLDAGSVVNTATATSGTTTSPPTSHTLTATQAPALSIVKSTSATGFSTVGTPVPYTFTVTNSGNTTLTTAVTVIDSKVAAVTCNGLPTGGLVPGASLTCSGSYSITQADIDAGSVTNTASAKSGTVTSPTTQHTLNGTQSPALTIAKSSATTKFSATGLSIGYSYTVTNSGNTTLTSAVTVTDSKIASVTCNVLPTGGLAPGASLTCSGTYATTQADIDAGGVTNTAAATSGSTTSLPVSLTIPATQSPALTTAKSASPTTFAAPGVMIAYSYAVKNTGNVTLTSAVSVTDNKIATVNCPPLPSGGLAPGATLICSGTYTTTQADVDAGSVTNTASSASGTTTSPPTSATVTASRSPALTLVKSSSATGYNSVGQTVPYTFTVTNSGNTTITSAVTVTDSKIASVTCNVLPTGGLAPGASLACTGSYTVTQADIDAGSIVNTASATSGPTTSPPTSHTLTANQTQGLSLTKSASSTSFNAAGVKITYQYVVRNSGNATIPASQTMTIADNKIASVTCPALPAGGIAPGASLTCSATYTTTQADLDAGSITNTASASDGLATSPTVLATVIGNQAPALAIAKSTTATTYKTVGQSIPYTFTVTNSGNVTLTSAVTVTDSRIAAVTCNSLPTGGLAPGGTLACAGSYIITQADIDAGSVVNAASAQSGTTTSQTVTHTLTATQTPGLTIAKSSPASSFAAPGTAITYTYRVTNSGNTTLTAAVSVSDNKIASVTCNALPTGGLAPGASLTCSGSYTTTQADIDAGGVTNNASASSGPTTSPTTSLTIPASKSPALTLVKSGTTSAITTVGQTVTYTYAITNTGNTTLITAVTVSDNKIASVTCPALPSGGLAPNGSVSCSATYTVTQADLDAGGVTNTATATSGPTSSPPTTLKIPASAQPTLSVVKSASVSSFKAANVAITYVYTVTNTGNVTLTKPISITDNKISSVICSALPAGGLAPGASLTCQASYTTTQADVDAGGITNLATATSGTSSSPQVSLTVTSTRTPGLTVAKSTTSTTYTNVGDVVPYSFAVTNSGNTTITSAVSITDSKIGSFACPALPSGGLAPGATLACAANYTVTQADIDGGNILNTAYATSGPVTSPTVTYNLKGTQNPKLTISKSSTTTVITTVGQVVPYSYSATNTGNVTLTTAVTIADNKIASVTCNPLPSGGLVPNASITCTGSYTVTQADIDSGNVVNTATGASGVGATTVTSNTTSLTIPVKQSPALTLVKSAPSTPYTSVGQMVSYTFDVTNTGNITVTVPITIADNRISSVSCPALPSGGLVPGGLLTCAGTYTVTQADLDSGTVVNTATAKSGPTISSPPQTHTQTGAQVHSLSLAKSASTATFAAVGQSIGYTYAVTNTGTVTIPASAAISVSDDKITAVSCPAVPPGGLAPNATLTCTATYSVSQADLDAGSIVNKATATDGTATSPKVQVTVTASKAPALSIVKSTTTTSFNAANVTVPYTFTVTNSGNTTITTAITVTDTKISSVVCNGLPAGGLVPGGTLTCSGSYTTTQADIDAGSVVNQAFATSGPTQSPTVSHTLPASQTRALSLAKSASPTSYATAGVTITYSYAVTNSGNVTTPASATVSVADNKLGSIACPAIPAGGLAPGATLMCKATYKTTQADVDTGSITNIASATDGVVTSPTTSATVSAVQAPSLSIVKDSTVTTYSKVGDVIPYTFTVTNSGNTTQTQAISIVDNKVATVTCPPIPSGGFMPGGVLVCNGSYTITQADIDSGTVTNTAFAKSGTTTSTPPVTHTLTGSQAPALGIVKSTSSTGFAAPGAAISYSYVVTNKGNTTLTSAVTVSDDKIASVACNPLPSGGLAPNGSITCSATYTTTQADVDAGKVVNTASATSGLVTSPRVSVTVNATQKPALTLAKSTTATGYSMVGAAIPYSYVVTNSGNTTLTSAITVSDSKIAAVACPALPTGGLAPNATLTCSASYTVTQADIDAGSITNIASAKSGSTLSPTSTVTVIATQGPALAIAKSSTFTSFGAVNTAIPYTYTVTNAGNTTITKPITVSDNKITAVTCNGLPTGGLAPGASITCSGSYTTTQADIDAGRVTNTASAKSGAVQSPTTSLTINAVQAPGLSVAKSSATTAYSSVNASISYTYTVTNSGNSTLTSSVTIADNKIPAVTCNGLPSGGLAPGGTLTCSGTYTVTQADIDAGKIVNTATASSGTLHSPQVVLSIPATQSPALSIVKSTLSTGYAAPGAVIAYSYKVTNSGNTTLTSAVKVSDDRIATVSCPVLPTGGLAPAAFIVCMGTYVTTQADVDAGKVVNTASASSGSVTSPTSSATVNATQAPALAIAKASATTSFNAVGQSILYSYTVTNAGNTTLTKAVTVTDDKITAVTCQGLPAGGLMPGARLTCAGSYVTTQADLDAGKVTNNATATSGSVTSPPATLTINALQSSSLAIVKSSTSTSYGAVNASIVYSYQVTNTGNTTLTKAVTVTDNRIASVTCNGLPVAGLLPGGAVTCSGTYVVTQADIDAGHITNTAFATSGTATSPPTSLTINGAQTPGLTIVKSSTTATYAASGVVIPYSYKVTNSGNTTLTSPVLVADNKIVAVSCQPMAAGGLVPGAFVTCSGSYTTTQADVDAGRVTNTASASSAAVKSNTASLTVTAVQTPALGIAKSSTNPTYSAVGAVIPYNYKVTNAGNVTLTTVITVSDNKIAAVTCPALPLGGLLPGAFITCAGSYKVTQADIDAGSVTNTASAASGAVASPTVSFTINATQSPALTLVKSSASAAYATVGTVIGYSYKVSNAGNTTLTSVITVSDDKIAAVACPALPAGGLLPAAFITCAGSYTITQADIDAGSLTNTASAKSGALQSPPTSLTLTAVPNPALAIVKSTSATNYTAIGDLIAYAYKVTNTGNTTLTSAITVTDNKIPAVTCQTLPLGGLPPAGFITCSGSYAITQADLDAGAVTNTAVAKSGTVTSPLVAVTLVGTQRPDFTVVKTTLSPVAVNNGDGSFTATFSLATTNAGNVDLADVQLVDNYQAALPQGASVVRAAVKSVTSSVRGPLATLNQAYGATATAPNVLAGTGETLAVGETVTAVIDIAFNPGAGTGGSSYTNQVTATTIFNKGTAVARSASRTSSAPVTFVPNKPLIVSKTTPKTDIVKGELIPYTITVTNNGLGARSGLTVVDNIPAGFAYRVGSASINGVVREPVVAGRLLQFTGVTVSNTKPLVIKLMLIAGAGIGAGEFTNQAWMQDGGAIVSNVGTATVRMTGDPTFDCTDIIGKVFDDANQNGYPDEGERGVADVRLATVWGQLITTDSEGRYHIACADIPQTSRGTNFILKLDTRTLPTGYRVTTENPRVIRITAGKMAKINFGVSLSRVARLDVTDAAFEPGDVTLKDQWAANLGAVIAALKTERSILRITYRRFSGEGGELAERRLRHLQDTFMDAWRREGEAYPLVIEAEIQTNSGRAAIEPAPKATVARRAAAAVSTGNGARPRM